MANRERRDFQHQFDEAFRAHYAELIHFAQQYVGDEEECHDIVSSAYEDLWRQGADYGVDNVRALLYRMVRNKCIDCLRHQSTQQQYAELAMRLSERFTDEDRLAEEDERQQRVRQVLNLLEPPTIDIFKACYLGQKHYQEVADEMGISLSTVKKHMVRALRIIREKYIKSASGRNFSSAPSDKEVKEPI